MGSGLTDTGRLVEALQYAAMSRAGVSRKGADIPHLSLLMGVASIVQEHGGDEDQVIAALLQDAIEDHPQDGLDLFAALLERGLKARRAT